MSFSWSIVTNADYRDKGKYCEFNKDKGLN